MENIAVCDAYFEIRSIEVTELINKELFGKNDPKVLLEFGDLVYQTAVRHEAGAQTTWHFDPPLILECDNFQIDHNSLTISVFDNNEITFDVLIGKTSLPLTEVVFSPTKTEHKNVMVMELKTSDGRKAGVFHIDIIHQASEPGPHISGERFQPRRANKSPLLLFENSKPGSPGNTLTLGGGAMAVAGLKKAEKRAKETIQEEMELWKTNVLEHHAAPKVQWKELDDQGSEVSDDRSKSGSLRASIGGMSMKLHLEHHHDEGDAYSDPSDTMPGKIRWREGRYKLGKKQFISNPYIFIPGKMMLQSSFNFTSIFKDLKLTVPSLIFRLSRALKTSTWNVKLPPSRKYLVDAYKKLLEIKSKQGGNTNPVKRNPQHTDLLIESTAPPPTSEDEYTKNLRGSIDHYHKVLDENCRRLLRSTNAACIQAQTLYQLTEIWSDDCDEDVVAEWAQLSNPKGPMPIFLGIADKTDFHESVWAQLRKGCVENYQQAEKDGKEPEEVIIDPTPFFDKRIPVTYNPITGHPTKSIPHPALTHLIISDNRTLLEQKIAEVVLWGVILINGGIREAELGAQAVQLGLPMVAFKYTGGAADIIIDMAEKVDKWVHQKRAKMLTVAELPPRPFPDDIQVGFLPPGWMKPFDQHLVVSCCLLNKLIENWPDRYNKQSVFCIDMFETPEDEVQDRLTLTVGVVSGGDYELGGVASEQKRISYAWRCRQKFLYNAFIYLVIADMLQILLALFILFSTLAATFYTFTAFAFYNPDRFPPGLKPLSASRYKDVMTPLLLINIVVPLIGTVIRGITAAISPYMKYVALTNACVRIEGEVYTFRCKVAQYSSLKQDDDDDEEEEEGGEGEKGDDAADDAGLPNPRKTFFQALDRIWADLSASDLQNGTLRAPISPAAAIDDINARIRGNRKEQLTYLIPIQRRGRGGEKEKDGGGKPEEEDNAKKKRGIFQTLRDIFSGGAKIAVAGSDDIQLDDGVSPLSADDYVVLRVIPMAALMTKQAPSYSWLRIITQALGVIFSVMASALTAFELIAFIPAVLALAGFVSTMSQYWQIELRLMQTNAARSSLHQLLVWWESLTLIEKRVPANKTKLVKMTEATIQAQATVFQGGGGGGGDDEGGDEGS